jgi:hypothetical protein
MSRTWMLASCLVFAACAMPLPEGDEEEESIGLSAEAITNGNVTLDEHNGIVALQYFSTSLNSWVTFCSGTLMTNRHIITAKHCLEQVTQGVHVKMGSQRIALNQKASMANWDLAVASLVSPMMMWNWHHDRFLTMPPLITNSGYGRLISSATNVSLENSALLCLGYGGATSTQPQPPLKNAILSTRYDTVNVNPANPVITMRTNGQLQENGDSGGPCLNGFSIGASQLAYVQSGCNLGLGACFGAGAESFQLWAYLTMLAMP